MKRIGLISDTHSYLDPKVAVHFADCDEIWHAGDFGSHDVAQKLRAIKPLRGVYGNIDGQDIRSEFEECAQFEIEGVRVMMFHIGGYPPNYNKVTKPIIAAYKPQLFISGHSHILKVIYDPAMACLHINPGAAGKQGWQKVRTLIKIDIDGTDIKNCQIIELGTRV
jgi:putative phosphoesterase